MILYTFLYSEREVERDREKREGVRDVERENREIEKRELSRVIDKKKSIEEIERAN